MGKRYTPNIGETAKIITSKYLSPRSTEDVEKFTEWLNDFETTDYLGRSGALVTIESEKEYLEKHTKSVKKKQETKVMEQRRYN